MTCRICGGTAEPFDRHTVLGQHEGEYLRCKRCGSVQVVDPTWLDEAYSQPIATTDVGLASRAFDSAAQVGLLLRTGHPRRPSSLDYGAGNGLFVRLMRDRGFDFRWHDPFTPNEFAVGHEGDPDEAYELITLIEVVEHLVDPVGLLRKLSRHCNTIYISTNLVGDPAPPVGEWWYYGPETGQHITFFSERGFQLAAAELGMHYTGRGSTHILSHDRLSLLSRKLATHSRVARAVGAALRWPTLLPDDHAEAVNRAN